MTPTPVSTTPTRPSCDRYATAPDDQWVRPLPSTEPRAGAPAGPAAGVPSPPRTAGAEDEVPVPARRAAHAVVLMALEVVDRRRPPHQTRGVFPPHLVEMLRVLARDGVPGQDLGPARLHRLHINTAGPTSGDAPGCTDYEVCATYARGPRLFAVAARIGVMPTGATCSALRLV